MSAPEYLILPSELELVEVTKEHRDSYVTNYACFRPGIKPSETTDAYDKLAVNGTYDKVMFSDAYCGPEVACEVLKTHHAMQSRRNVKILDIGAGTGRLGKLLNDNGFLEVDALEPSTGMLQVAREKNLYRKYFNEYINEETSTISDDEYDTVVGVGCFGEGHIPCIGLLELIRITKMNGLVVIVMREEYLRTASEYNDRFERFLGNLEEEGVWISQEKTIIPNYAFGKDGVIFVYEVTGNSLSNAYDPVTLTKM